MEKVYIQWNMVNWITVILMVALGSALAGIVMSALGKYSTPNAAE